MQLKSKINNKAKSLNISPQFVLQNYIMECFIKRISISEYKNNFILKGGLLIASLVGIQNRSTMDMDTTITGFTLEKEETILSRNIENTRPRDFYDILALMPLTHNCNSEILREALFNTSKRRSSEKYLKNTKVLVETIKVDTFMNSLWQKYAKKQPYAENITFEKVCSTVENLLDKIGFLN